MVLSPHMIPQATLIALTVFLGSFLLFAVQPMMGRMLLPSFGGSAAVWTVCLAAYQILLLAGYGYAHGLSKWPFARQRRLHGFLLALAVVWMCGLQMIRRWLLSQVGNSFVPPLEVLVCVVLGVGLPYVLLASGSSLLQAWLARTGSGKSVYGLYAISNLGSLLGLFSYPLLVEPRVSLTWQWAGWTIGLCVYALLVAIVLLGRRGPVGQLDRGPVGQSNGSTVRPPDRLFPAFLSQTWAWYVLPACSSFLLVAVTNHLSLDVEPLPLMWVFLLGAFLLSYAVGFSGFAHKLMPIWACLATIALGVQAWHGLKAGKGVLFLLEMLRGGGVLFLVGVFLHSWLYKIRPHTDRLTAFYLGIAVGGALGGATASLLPPVLFQQVLEYPLALVFAAALVACFAWQFQQRRMWVLNMALLLICLAVPFLLGWRLVNQGQGVIYRARNFYGALRVTENARKIKHTLVNGDTLHGTQTLFPGLSHLGTAYYGPLGGGFAVLQHPAYSNRALRVGCVGLGAGTMAVYGRSNDVYRFFEINPQVVGVAVNPHLFTYLIDSPAQVQFAVKDARKALVFEAAHGDPRYDVLIVDAYSGDAIPIHLATREAYALYLSRLAPDGILAVHISNRYIDLLPLCKAMARDLHLHLLGLVSEPQPAILTSTAHWVLMSRNPLPLAGTPIPHVQQVDWAQVRDMRTLTDETGSLLELVCFDAYTPAQDVDHSGAGN